MSEAWRAVAVIVLAAVAIAGVTGLARLAEARFAARQQDLSLSLAPATTVRLTGQTVPSADVSCGTG